MVSKINSIGIYGINPYMVTVEADVNDGMPTFDIVGLPDNAVKESKNRVRSAIKNSGYLLRYQFLAGGSRRCSATG